MMVILASLAVLWIVGAIILLRLYFGHGQGNDRAIVVLVWTIGLALWPISFPVAWTYDGVTLFLRRRSRP